MHHSIKVLTLITASLLAPTTAMAHDHIATQDTLDVQSRHQRAVCRRHEKKNNTPWHCMKDNQATTQLNTQPAVYKPTKRSITCQRHARVRDDLPLHCQDKIS